jgi:hypothetical protein
VTDRRSQQEFKAGKGGTKDILNETKKTMAETVRRERITRKSLVSFRKYHGSGSKRLDV